MVEVKETRFKKTLGFIEKKEKYYTASVYSKYLFLSLLMLTLLTFYFGSSTYTTLFLVSLLPLITWTITYYLNFSTPVTLFELINFNLFKARKNTTFYRTRKDEVYYKKSIKYVLDSIQRLEELLVEMKTRPLLSNYTIHKDIESAHEILKYWIYPNLFKKKNLKEVEEALEELVNVFTSRDLKKMPKLKEEIIDKLEKGKFIEDKFQSLSYKIKTNQKTKFFLVSTFLVLITVPLIMGSGFGSQEKVGLIVFSVCLSILISLFNSTKRIYTTG